MGKRKHDRKEVTSSSDAKRCRSSPDDRMPVEGLSEIFSSFREVLIELKEIIQEKVSTQEMLKRKITKLKNQRKMDKKKHKEEHSRLKEDLDQLRLEIRKRQKEGCSEVNRYDASPSQRSQQHTRFRLVIESRVKSKVYKGETVQTDDAGDSIKVVLYDGGNPVACDHHLASVTVDLVVIEGRFNEPNRNFWSKEDFEKSIIKPRKRDIIKLVINGTFDLIGGSCVHQGAIIMESSCREDVKLGAIIALHTEERVLEGVSNPFKVQHRPRTNHSHPVPAPTLVQPISTHTTQHGQGPGEQHNLPPPVIQNPLQAAGSFPLNQILLASAQDQYTNYLNANFEPVFGNLFTYPFLNEIESGQWNFNPGPEGQISVGDVQQLNVPAPNQETYGSHMCGRVLLRWDEPNVQLKERWNFLDQVIPLYSTQSLFWKESFPCTSLMDDVHRLLSGISPGDSVVKTITSVTCPATAIPRKRSVLIRPTESYDSYDEPPVKPQRHGKYKLRFVNRVCNDYYTREQIKSDDGNLLKVALYDENNLVVTSGPLSSASVELVLLHGDFSSDGQEYWTSEEFSTCLVYPKYVKKTPALGGDPVLRLIYGEANLGNVNFQISSHHARTGKFKMGAEIKNATEARVQEGITSPFLVRVRQGEEPSRHGITSPKELLPLRLDLPKQAPGALECVGSSTTVGLKDEVRTYRYFSSLNDLVPRELTKSDPKSHHCFHHEANPDAACNGRSLNDRGEEADDRMKTTETG